MKNFFKNNIKLFIGIFIGIICSGITVYAANYLAKDIAFVPSNANWKVTSVEEALNDLYNDQNDYSLFVGLKWDFDYTGSEQTLKIPMDATYKIETWGAQGGNATSSKKGGYGGYSVGEIVLSAGETLYINVGGQGSTINGIGYKKATGGYNGGGVGQTTISTQSADSSTRYVSGGGGATHVAKTSGLLSMLESKKSNLIIVSGGGAGNWYMSNTNWKTISVGSGGGYIGGKGESSRVDVNHSVDGGTQNSSGEIGEGFGTFGQAAVVDFSSAGAGGGLYGGNITYYAAGGGSGYIGNTNLKNKVMYCYNCSESNEENTKTVSTTNVSSSAISNYAKEGNGFARITLIGV